MRQDLHALQRPSLLIELGAAVGDHVLIVVFAAASVFVWLQLPVLAALPLYILLAIAAAREMRGLECLVHEASHYHWTRRKFVNDLFANLSAAWPVLSRVAKYRKTHFLHHDELGTDQDTDLVRWQKLQLKELPRDHLISFSRGVVKRLGMRYILGWWWAIGVDAATWARFAVWHAVLILAAASVTSVSISLEAWTLGWAVPFFVVLPAIRFLGEIEEHRYGHVPSVVQATYTNLGFFQRLILHPHGDAYHTLHHILAGVPFFRIGALHRRLSDTNLNGYRELVPVRHRLLSETWGG